MKFHLIVACDVFEHVLNEGDAILSVSHSLCNEGALYVRSPYKEPSINYATRLGAPFPFIHLRTYSKRSLQNLVESSGLRTKELRLGKIVMMSHTRRNLFFKERYFEMLRTDLSNAYGNRNSINNSEPKRNLYSKLKKMYEKYENKALSSGDSEGRFSWVGRKIFFRPAEIWCLAVKTRND
jgi:hypothetical protein